MEIKKHLRKHCAILGLLLLMGCSGEEKYYIHTCMGVMSTDDLGKALTHEHILVDFIGADSTGYHRWIREDVVLKVFPYLEEIRKHGYLTLFECTPAYLGRDPLIYKELSNLTGLNIITNTGFYGAFDNRFIPEYALYESAEQLADRWIDEFTNGIDNSGIKPGFIKIAIDRDSVLSEMHKKLVIAAAKTHLKTGMTIASHTGPSSGAYRQAEILRSEGVSLEAFIWVHALEGSAEDNIKLAKQGMWISFDKMDSKPHTVQLFVDRLKAMKEAEMLHKVLLSHDAGWYKPGQEDGGSFRPFTSIETLLLPELKVSGFTEEEIFQVMVKNPAKAFGMRVRELE
jgi:phosphotriesterase-related protein